MSDSVEDSGLLSGHKRLLAIAGVLVVLALVGTQLWRSASQRVVADPRYRITAEAIETTPPPAWVRSDVRSQALAGAGLQEGLSALDPPQKLEARLIQVFTAHPWVKSVGRIAKRPPNRLSIELVYRTPLAAVGHPSGHGELLLVDDDSVRLPESDLSEAELRHLPRITLPPVNSPPQKPLPGETWADPRVQGAASIVSNLGEVWWDLQLAEVRPSQGLEVHGAQRYFAYDVISQSGTRIIWGAAPTAAPPGELPFQDKLAHLVGYVQTNGTLNATSIDVRSRQVQIVPRTALEENAGKSEVLK